MHLPERLLRDQSPADFIQQIDHFLSVMPETQQLALQSSFNPIGLSLALQPAF